MAYKNTDGKSITLTADKNVNAGDFALIRNFHGIAFESASSGDLVTLNIEHMVIEMTVSAGLTYNVGDIIYMDSNGALTMTATNNRAVLRAVEAKDTNNVGRFLMLGQRGV